MDSMVTQTGSAEMGHVCFFILEESFLASAAMSFVGRKWWFERLIVHRSMRGKGYASLLVDAIVELCRENKLFLECNINPYGDMDLQQLRSFYIRHGFQETEHDDTVILNCMEPPPDQGDCRPIGKRPSA